tara:strand:- start:1588 stop:1815 length:228 start_codon:yes stop_codon:yes gene_type:complete
MNVIGPNKQEKIVIIIIISLFVGFTLGAFSRNAEIKEKDEQIVELIDVTDSLLNNFEFPNNTNHPLNFHKTETDK